MGAMSIVDQELWGDLSDGFVLLDGHKMKGLPATRATGHAIGACVWGLVAVTSRPVSLNQRGGGAVGMRETTARPVGRIIEIPGTAPAGLRAFECGDACRVKGQWQGTLEDRLGVLGMLCGRMKRLVKALVVGAS